MIFTAYYSCSITNRDAERAQRFKGNTSQLLSMHSTWKGAGNGVGIFVACATSNIQTAHQGPNSSDNRKRCHTQTAAASPVCCLTQPQYSNTGPTSPSADPVVPGIRQGSLYSLYADCLMSQQHASVSQRYICTDNFTCCHTEIEVADQTFYLTQSQYTDTGPTSPCTDPIMPGAWQGSHWSANFKSLG